MGEKFVDEDSVGEKPVSEKRVGEKSVGDVFLSLLVCYYSSFFHCSFPITGVGAGFRYILLRY